MPPLRAIDAAHADAGAPYAIMLMRA